MTTVGSLIWLPVDCWRHFLMSFRNVLWIVVVDVVCIFVLPLVRLELCWCCGVGNDSFHPPSTKKAIIYSQALRYRRIITNDQTLQQRLNNLAIILINRGYKHETITEAIQQATQHSQSELLYKDKTLNNSTYSIFTIPYNNNTTQHTLDKYYENIGT